MCNLSSALCGTANSSCHPLPLPHPLPSTNQHPGLGMWEAITCSRGQLLLSSLEGPDGGQLLRNLLSPSTQQFKIVDFSLQH